MPKPKEVYILGAGPSGLVCAIELLKSGYDVTIIEKQKEVGGQCRTNTYETSNGTYRFDFGGHRFITHNSELLKLVEEVLAEDLLLASRKSVIRFKGKTYAYPLSLSNLIKVAPLGLLFNSFIDLIKIALKITRPDNKSFESWISSRFGNTLYKNFFGPFTTKLWGISPAKLSSDWAGQRISLVDLKDVVKRMLPFSKDAVRTYAKLYRYPKYGFGQLPLKLANKVKELGGKIILEEELQKVEIKDKKIISFSTNKNTYSCDNIISTIPLNEMAEVCGMNDCKLGFRSLRFLNIALKDIENISDNTWQYLSDSYMLATRLQEPKRRSSFMAPEGTSSIMLEIPCNKNDEIWDMPEEQLLEKILAEIKTLGYDLKANVVDSFSAFEEHAYTLMDIDYNKHRDETINYLNDFENLLMCGRQGTFRYIFVDSAMETGIMAARKLLGDDISKDSIYNHRNEKIVIETQSIV